MRYRAERELAFGKAVAQLEELQLAEN